MSLFQKSVEKKYLSELDSVLIDKKNKAFKDYFGNPSIQENIRNSKEEQFQEGFLRELFVSIFGYTLNPQLGSMLPSTPTGVKKTAFFTHPNTLPNTLLKTPLENFVKKNELNLA